MKSPTDARSLVVLGAALLLFGALSFSAAQFESPTCDEPTHVTAGYAYWKTGRYDLDPMHTPLLRLWISLPLIASDLPDLDAAVNEGRFMVVLLSVLLGFVLWKWAYDALGATAAWASLAAYVFCPAMLEYSHLATTDMGTAVFSTLALYAAWRYTRAPSSSRAAAAGLAMGLAMMAKLSAWVLVPLCVGLAASEGGASAVRGRSRAAGFLRPAAAYFLAAAAVVLLCYRVVELPRLLAGIGDLRRHLDADIPHFFHGRYNDHGAWPWFLPMTFLLKTPIPFLLLTGAGLWLLASKRYDRGRFASRWLLLAVLLTLASSCFVNSQFGIRRLLFLYPLLCLFIGGAWSSLLKRSRRWLLPGALLAAWYGGATLYLFPRYLSYFNEAAGGPSEGYRYLVDCSLDWGQGLEGLGRYLRTQGVHEIYLSYFGAADPHRYGIKYIAVAPGGPSGAAADAPEEILKEKKVLFAISATNLQGLYYKDHHSFDWLKERKPAAVIMDSIRVYDITEDDDAHDRLAEKYRSAGMADDARRERLWAGAIRSTPKTRAR